MTKILHIPTGIVIDGSHSKYDITFTKQTLNDLFDLNMLDLFDNKYEKCFFVVRRFIDALYYYNIYKSVTEESYYVDINKIREKLNILEFEVLDD